MLDRLQLCNGQLYLMGPDGPELLGNVFTIEPEEEAEMEPWPKENPFTSASRELTLSIKLNKQEVDKLIDALVGFSKAVLELCPNKRVVHLAKHGRKWRTRKKNRRRAYRILEKEGLKQ